MDAQSKPAVQLRAEAAEVAEWLVKFNESVARSSPAAVRSRLLNDVVLAIKAVSDKE